MSINSDLVQVLESTVSADHNLLNRASEFLANEAKNNFSKFVVDLSVILKDTNQSQLARVQAALQLKNQIYSKDSKVQTSFVSRWLNLPDNLRSIVKTNCIESLGTEPTRPSQAAQCVEFIAFCELPRGQWTDVIDILVNKVVQPDIACSVREASLEAIGYICNDLSVKCITDKSNEILTAIACGINSQDNTDDNVKLAAINALLNSIEFTEKNFDVETERNYIMQIVCEATQNSNTRIVTTSLQVINKIMDLYYKYMGQYMEQALFAISVDAMRSPITEIALQGIEFWSTICEVELEIIHEVSDVNGSSQLSNGSSNKKLLNFACSASTYIVPYLFQRLSEQNGGDDEDEWNPCKAASVCLTMLAEVSGDRLIEPVMTFVNEYIHSSEWKCRDAAVMAFGSIIVDVPSSNLVALAENAPAALLPMMRDENITVRDTVAWAIGRLCDNIPEVCLSEPCLHTLLDSMMSALDDKPRVAHNVCWALSSLAHSAKAQSKDASAEAYPLSPYFWPLIQKLLLVSERNDASENQLRSAVYGAIESIVQSGSKNCYPYIRELYLIVLFRLEKVLDIESEGGHGHGLEEIGDLEEKLCGTLQAIVSKLNKSDNIEYSGRLVKIIVRVLESKLSAQFGANLVAINILSLLCMSIKSEFAGFLDSIMIHILNGLNDHFNTEVFLSYITLYEDICRSVPDISTIYLEKVLNVLFCCLMDQTLNMELRPPILNLLGCIAGVNGNWFYEFLPHTMTILQKAAEVNIDTSDNLTLQGYVSDLNDSCVLACTGIINGIVDAGNKTTLQEAFKYAQLMLFFADKTCTIEADYCKDSMLYNAIGLVGDLVQAYGSSIADLLQTYKIQDLLNKAKGCRDQKTRQLAIWATSEIKRRINGVSN